MHRCKTYIEPEYNASCHTTVDDLLPLHVSGCTPWLAWQELCGMSLWWIWNSVFWAAICYCQRKQRVKIHHAIWLVIIWCHVVVLQLERQSWVFLTFIWRKKQVKSSIIHDKMSSAGVFSLNPEATPENTVTALFTRAHASICLVRKCWQQPLYV